MPPRHMLLPEVDDLWAHLKTQLGRREPRNFQVELIRAQEERQDSICQAVMGMGKTAIAAGPYALEKNQGHVTFMISPLIGLQNEMVRPSYSHHAGVSFRS